MLLSQKRASSKTVTENNPKYSGIFDLFGFTKNLLIDSFPKRVKQTVYKK